MERISREEAIRLGLKRYFTGVPCKNGHVSERRLKGYGGQCVACHRLTLRRQKERDPEKARQISRLAKQKQRARDPERVRQQWREWFARKKAKETAAAEMETARSRQ